MEALIRKNLKEIEKEKKITVLFACESGSRAWGFPSPDSDYDVRFIYMHPTRWYLSIDDHKDTIELPIDEKLDMGGWDIAASDERFCVGRKNTIVDFLKS